MCLVYNLSKVTYIILIFCPDKMLVMTYLINKQKLKLMKQSIISFPIFDML
jgi:hypothetical protein